MQRPEPGFYYHYKHNPEGAINNYAYEVMGLGHHTEIDGLEDSLMVMYRPLYETAGVYLAGKHYDLRPYDMFMESVIKGDKTIVRFQKITDENIIKQLEEIRDRMY